jgi:hypothetical protein
VGVLLSHDDAYRKAKLLLDSPERTALYDTMTRQLEAVKNL